MSPRLRGLAVLAYAGASMAALFAGQLPVMLATGSGDFSIWLARNVWASSALRLAGVEVRVHGRAALPEGPAIYASNHESALDVWALLRAIPRNLRFVAKQELFRIPIFGWYLKLARFVAVDRRDRAQAVLALHRAADIVRSGTSLIVFPEGTRSSDGRIQPFKKGPFVLAMEARVPVVPIAIAGACERTPKGRIEVHPGMIDVALGDPVHPGDFSDKDALLREVRLRIIELHRSMGGQGGDREAAIAMPGAEGVASREA
jgi:1-acyl-sn-glycerol-3-phosphate acyltransferase